MDEQLQRLQRWADHGSMPRFYTELALRLAGEGYELELEGETLTVYRWQKARGPAGWLGRSIREPVLLMVRRDGRVVIPRENADAGFVTLLLDRLRTY